MIGIAVLVQASCALGQDASLGPYRSNSPSRPPDAYVDDSFEASERIDRIESYARAGRWDEASRAVQEAFTSYENRLIRVNARHYESVVERLHRMVGGWPAEGLAAYQALYDKRAQVAFERAAGRRDVGALVGVLERYYCTGPAEQAAKAIYELGLESGDFSLSRWACRQMIDAHPSHDAVDAAFTARLAVVSAVEGEADEARRCVSRSLKGLGRRSIRWQGRDVSLTDLVESLLSEAGEKHLHGEDMSWPVFGGDGGRNRRGGFSFNRTALLWRFDGLKDPVGNRWTPPEASDSSSPSVASGKRLMSSPVVGTGLVFLQNARSVWALQLDGGALRWRYRRVANDGAATAEGDSSVAEWHCPTFSDGRVFASMGSEAGPYYGYESTVGGVAVVCLDARTGKEIWRTGGDRVGPDAAKMTFGSSPLVSGESVFVTARRRRTFGFEDCYLIRLRASDGAVLQQTHLGSASTGGFGYRRPSLSIPAMIDGRVVVSTNLGTIASVSTHTGRVEWLRLYNREPEEHWRNAVRSTMRDVSPWDYNAVVCGPARLICRPNDVEAVLVLNRASGQIESTIPTVSIENVRTLLGLVDGRLYGVGDRVFCFDLDRKEKIWSAALPEHAVLYGRGVVSGDSVLIPTTTSLCRYDLRDGRLLEQAWNPAAAGNLLALPDRLIVSGVGQVSSYGRRTDVWSRLRSLMSKRPHDPLPALDLAETAFRTGERKEAASVLDVAIRRSGEVASTAGEAIRTRLYRDLMWFANDWPRTTRSSLERVRSMYEQACRFAPDRLAHVECRFRFAEFESRYGEAGRAVGLYQQVLNDRSLRESRIAGREDDIAGVAARRQIADLIAKHSRSVYARFDAEAAEWLAAARETGDVQLLDRILETRPLATVAVDALIAKGDVLRRSGDAEGAAKTYIAALNRYPDRSDPANRMRIIADCYAEAGLASRAYLWITKAVGEYPAARVSIDDRPVMLRDYATRFEAARETLQARLPKVHPPLSMSFDRAFDHDIELLEPMLPPSPGSSWRALLVYISGEVHAFDARDGEALWRKPFAITTQPTLLLSTKDRAVLALPYQVVALDIRTGAKVWSMGQAPAGAAKADTDPESFVSFFSHVYAGGRLVSMQDDGRAACVEVRSGKIVWQTRMAHRPTSRLVLTDRWLVYRGVAGSRTHYCVVDPSRGVLLRTIDPAGEGDASLFFVTPDDRLVAVQSKSIHCYDLRTGGLLWRSVREDNIAEETVAMDLDGIYLSDDSSRMSKISLDDGHSMWQSEPLFEFGLQFAQTEFQAGSLAVLTGNAVIGLDTVNGGIVCEQKVKSGAEFARFLLGEDAFVAIDGAVGEASQPFTVYFFPRCNGSARPTALTGQLTLGTFDKVRRVALRDGAIVLQTPRRLYGWSSAVGKK